MVEEQSDDDGQPDGWDKMSHWQSDVDRWSDRLIVGLIGGVTDGYVNDKLTGCQTGWSSVCHGLTVQLTDGLTDRLMGSQTDWLCNRWTC